MTFSGVTDVGRGANPPLQAKLKQVAPT